MRSRPISKPVKKTAASAGESARKPTTRKAAAPKAERPPAARTPASARPDQTPEPDWGELLTDTVRQVQSKLAAEIAAVKTALEEALAESRGLAAGRAVEAEPAPGAAGADPDVDQLTRTFRRSVAEVLEQRAEGLGERLAGLHSRLEALEGAPADTERTWREQLRLCVGDLAEVLTGLGVARFEARPGDVFDPLIHTAVADDAFPGLEAGRVGRVIAPGYHSSRGRVLVPCRVVVSRG